jgi:hypothetical protein
MPSSGDIVETFLFSDQNLQPLISNTSIPEANFNPHSSHRSCLMRSALLASAAEISSATGMLVTGVHEVAGAVDTTGHVNEKDFSACPAMVDNVLDRPTAESYQRLPAPETEDRDASADRSLNGSRSPYGLSEPTYEFVELTIDEAACDPLIALLNEADRVNGRAFEQLLRSAARVLGLDGGLRTNHLAPGKEKA